VNYTPRLLYVSSCTLILAQYTVLKPHRIDSIAYNTLIFHIKVSYACRSIWC